jgi:hypothetical protein
MDLSTLKQIKSTFELCSDDSTMCLGYRNLCRTIEKLNTEQMKKKLSELTDRELIHVPDVEEIVRIGGNSWITDRSFPCLVSVEVNNKLAIVLRIGTKHDLIPSSMIADYEEPIPQKPTKLTCYITTPEFTDYVNSLEKYVEYIESQKAELEKKLVPVMVKCEKLDGYRSITIGKEYLLKDENNGNYLIVDDDNDHFWYDVDLFTKV